FLLAAVRYWGTVFPQVVLQAHRLRRCARGLSDPRARELALAALGKRSNLEGAAAFAAFVPWRRRADVVRALVAFQAAYNYADVLAEQPSRDPVEDARRAHEPLLDALEVHPVRGRPDAVADPFAATLVADCRRALARLPSYALVAPHARRCAERIVAFQSLSLGPAGELERWAEAAGREHEGLAGFEWWELAAAAGSSLAVHALIAAAAKLGLSDAEGEVVERAYFPAIGALHSLLDSLVDRDEDAATRQLSLVGFYPEPEDAAAGLERLAAGAMRQARSLPAWRANTLLVVAMACSYLADTPRHEPREPRERVLAALGPLARPALSVFALRRLLARPWRRARLADRSFDAEPQRADARTA
ncbi:MAG TPA: DUF2600 family protein, partial [Solirubrobacteraceae bacterium]|nr:DUF2600 family protein [Solirubrobacteraceae bacterium]